MGFFLSPCPFPYGESLYGNGEGSFGAPLSHALITQILEFWAIQRAPLLTKLGDRCSPKNFAPDNQPTENYADEGKGGLRRRRC
jgi:hypothetical protein